MCLRNDQNSQKSRSLGGVWRCRVKERAVQRRRFGRGCVQTLREMSAADRHRRRATSTMSSTRRRAPAGGSFLFSLSRSHSRPRLLIPALLLSNHYSLSWTSNFLTNLAPSGKHSSSGQLIPFSGASFHLFTCRKISLENRKCSIYISSIHSDTAQ